MHLRILLPLTASFLFTATNLLSQTPSADLTVEEIKARADSVMVYQDSLISKIKYTVREEFVFNEIDGKGKIEKSDTAISIVTFHGNDEVSRQVEYSTRDEEGGKKEKKEEVGFSLSSSDDSLYNFSLTGITDSSYIIAVSPKDTSKKGMIRRTVEVDRNTFNTLHIDLEVLKPEGALKEFSSQIGFEPLEGGLLVRKDVKMKGYAKALLGIIKVRFTGHIRYSDYKIIQ